MGREVVVAITDGATENLYSEQKREKMNLGKYKHIVCSQATPCDLQTALGLASDGNTIYVAAGTYTGAGGAAVTVTKSREG